MRSATCSCDVTHTDTAEEDDDAEHDHVGDGVRVPLQVVDVGQQVSDLLLVVLARAQQVVTAAVHTVELHVTAEERVHQIDVHAHVRRSEVRV